MKHEFHVFEGDLWRNDKVFRHRFEWTFSSINNTSQFKATLRNKQYTWPGCYPLFLITSDGAALCFACARKEFRSIVDSIKHKSNDGWRIVACDANWEDDTLYCDHCSKQIESAYGEEENNDNAID